jgi:hypothetical protein
VTVARAITALLALAAAAHFSPPAIAQEPADVNPDEISAELAAREADISRTQARAAALEARSAEDAAAIDTARMEALESERALSERAAFLYRLGRRGAAFRYLFGAPSAAAFLERYATLKRLVIQLLEARRDAGAKLAEAEANLVRTRSELQSARSMLSQLEEARLELLAEQQRLSRSLARR